MELEKLAELLDRSVTIASDFLPETETELAAVAAKRTRNRIGYLGESVVIALAGGTGSGKSSLLNAMAGEAVAQAGVIRPTTSEALAWLPMNPEPGLVRMLDDMNIEHRVGHNQPRHVAVLDMPDTDSTEGSHRETFERLLPMVDAVVWVVDPEKYGDRILHADYLSPLARYADQFLFVMNQIDRLSEPELHDVLADFRERLAEDGISDPTIVPVAADPPGEQPRGVKDLLGEVDRRFEEKVIIRNKLVVDIQVAGEALALAAGLASGPLGFDKHWERTSASVSNQLVSMLAGPETVAIAKEQGAQAAGRAAAGPLGSLLAATKNSQIGRLLGVRPDDAAIEQSVGAWETRPGLEAVLGELEGFASEMAVRAGGPFAIKLRSEFGGDMSQRVRVAVARARESASAELRPEFLPWWKIISTVKWLLAATAGASAVWWWVNPLARGDWPWPLMVIATSLVVGLGLSRVADYSGRKAGSAVAFRYRDGITASVDEGLRRAIGSPMRNLLAARGELDASLTSLALGAEEVLSGQNRTNT